MDIRSGAPEPRVVTPHAAPRPVRGAAAVTAAALLLTMAGSLTDPSHPPTADGALQLTATTTQTETRTFGKSVQGRKLTVTTVGDPTAARRVLVFGCIHGNECAGTKVVNHLKKSKPPAGIQYVLVPTINPDGQRTGRRQNARGVDLNRNFPTRWKRAGKKWDTYYPGRKALSEPEARAAHQLIKDVAPTLTLWYHQQMNLVDFCGGTVNAAKIYGKRTGMKVKKLTRYGGSAATWQNAARKRTTILNVELPRRVTAAAVRRHGAAVIAAAKAAPGRPGNPVRLRAKTEGTRAHFSWLAASSNGAKVTGYDLAIRSQAAGSTPTAWRTTAVGAATRARTVAVEPGRTYTVRIRANNSQGRGQWSTIRFTTAAPEPTPTPTATASA